MNRSTASRSMAAVAALGVVQCLALAGTAGPAGAAEPNDGSYSYSVPSTTNPGAISAGIFFSVRSRSGDASVGGFRWYGEACGMLSLPGTLSVNNKDKFSFKGKASGGPAGAGVKVKVKGKFTGEDQAKVKVKDVDPAVDCGKLKATVKRG
jgi:hypothetical protein